MTETLWPDVSDIATLSQLVNRIASQHGEDAIKVVVPNGKAAMRVTQSLREAGSSITATTIYRALEIVKADNDFTFLHTESNPMTAKFYLVDESLRSGNEMFARFISAIPDNGELLLIGDPVIQSESLVHGQLLPLLTPITFPAKRRFKK